MLHQFEPNLSLLHKTTKWWNCTEHACILKCTVKEQIIHVSQWYFRQRKQLFNTFVFQTVYSTSAIPQFDALYLSYIIPSTQNLFGFPPRHLCHTPQFISCICQLLADNCRRSAGERSSVGFLLQPFCRAHIPGNVQFMAIISQKQRHEQVKQKLERWLEWWLYNFL